MATTITIPTRRTRAHAGSPSPPRRPPSSSPPPRRRSRPRPSLAADATKPDPHDQRVSGTGRVILAPDVADLRLGVIVQRTTVKAARADAAKAMPAVIDALKKLGIADGRHPDLVDHAQRRSTTTRTAATRRASIGYQFSQQPSPSPSASSTCSGDAIDDSLAAGATTLDSVQFRVDDETKAEAQARAAGDGRREGQGDSAGQRRRRLDRGRQLDQRDGRPDSRTRSSTAPPPAPRSTRPSLRRSRPARTK